MQKIQKELKHPVDMALQENILKKTFLLVKIIIQDKLLIFDGLERKEGLKGHKSFLRDRTLKSCSSQCEQIIHHVDLGNSQAVCLLYTSRCV